VVAENQFIHIIAIYHHLPFRKQMRRDGIYQLTHSFAKRVTCYVLRLRHPSAGNCTIHLNGVL